MLNIIDNFLNRTTMYRVVLYYLELLLGVAFILSFFGVLPFTPLSLLLSTAMIVGVCWIVNTVFAFVFEAPTNVESTFITALILALIVTPSTPSQYALNLSLIAWVAVWAMASKFLFAINHKHLFNPAAFAVVLTAFTINQSASWWVGSASMAAFVVLGGILIVRKLRRADLVLSFLIVGGVTMLAFGIARGGDIILVAKQILLNSPLLFFAFVMITEPLTTPPTRILRICYSVFVGFLFAPNLHLGPLYSTPELALLIGNAYSYMVSPKCKLILTLKERVRVTPTVFDFVFTANAPFEFRPGQYLEWTLGHYRPDSRGNRRYFTVASSPTEKDVRLGVKFYDAPSSFKKALAFMREGDEVVASQLCGDFVLPKDPNEKLAFIAGGIGITPFRSMIKYLVDKNEKRDISLFYSNRTADETAYKELFDEASLKLGIKTIYAVTDGEVPAWAQKGFITKEMIMSATPDYKERTFYISGPKVMVDAFRVTLKSMGVKSSKIKTDFFPGFA